MKKTKTPTSIGRLNKKTDRSKLNENTWVVFRGPKGEKKTTNV